MRSRDTINWQPYIHTDPHILADKPVIKGTRISVEFLLGLFAGGWTEQMVLENYPHLTPEAIHAAFAFAFAAECMQDTTFSALPVS